MCCREDPVLAGISWFHAGFLECRGVGQLARLATPVREHPMSIRLDNNDPSVPHDHVSVARNIS